MPKLDLGEAVTKEEIRQKLLDIVRSAERDSDRVNALKLLAQLEGYVGHGNRQDGPKAEVLIVEKQVEHRTGGRVDAPDS